MTPAEKAAAKRRQRKPKRRDKTFGVHRCRLREFRQGLGLVIRDVADGTGITVSCVCDVEHGAETTLTTARKLAAFFGNSVDEIWPVESTPSEAKCKPVAPSQHDAGGEG